MSWIPTKTAGMEVIRIQTAGKQVVEIGVWGYRWREFKLKGFGKSCAELSQAGWLAPMHKTFSLRPQTQKKEEKLEV